YWLALVVTAVLGAGALAYTLFRSSEVTELASSESKDPVVAAQSAETLELLSNLKRLSFDEALFRDPRFRSLIDFSVELTPEPKGRRNPFLPFSDEGGGAAGTSTSALVATSTRSLP
ncbi:MAG: hypothetical protein U1A28_00375, partial [Patescibacteria group bacterium]|nr:hypothetical protein [Patescibacteria group bacterium]